MTAYYDQHMHSNFSFDSEEQLENYLKITTHPIVTTEHFDLHNPLENGRDSIPDYEAYVDKMTELADQYQRPIYKGIEVGYSFGQAEQIQAFLVGKNYDLILLSIHSNQKYDYMEDQATELALPNLVEEYYGLMNEAIDQVPQANVLAHFEYGFRIREISVAEYRQLAEPMLTKVFQNAIDHDLAMEINSKSIILRDNLALYEYAIELWQSLGGTKFTLGSDAHEVAHFELGFPELKAMLKRHGVQQLVSFTHGEGKFVGI